MISWILLQAGAVTTATNNAVMDTLQQATGLVAPGASAPQTDSLPLLDLIIKGGIVMIPIGILSILTVYVLIERMIAISKASRNDNNFMNNIRDFIKTGNMDAAKTLCKTSSSPEAQVIGKGISRIGKPMREIESAMESEGKLELYKIEKNLNILSIIGRIAPMLGFIGTILGVIHIFYKIALADSISIGIIASGLYEKMVTSASGLIVGVIAFISYHILNIKVDKILNRMESSAAEFIDILQGPGK